MATMGEDTEHIGILDTDPGLEPFKDHFRYRMRRYVEQKELIEKYEGSLEEFAQGNILVSSVQVHYCFSLLLFMENNGIYFNIMHFVNQHGLLYIGDTASSTDTSLCRCVDEASHL